MFDFLKRKKIDPKKELKKLFGDYTLPSFSGTIMQTLRTIRDPNSSASNVAGELSMDPGLTVRLLRIANSPVFSPVKKIENVSQAVALVGLSQLESIVLSAAVSVSIPRASNQNFDFDRFWQVSILRAVLARELATVLHPTRAPEAFVAGFLQDLALPFLVMKKPDEYAPILKKWHEGASDLCAMEREVFDFDHAQVATWICSEWDFPEIIASAIGAHHGDTENVYQTLEAVFLVGLMGEVDQAQNNERLIQTADEAYGIDPNKTQQMIERSEIAAKELARLMH